MNRASRTMIKMDISQHASSVVYASWPCAINWPQHHTLDRKFQKRTCFINCVSVAYLEWCSRKNLASLWAIKLAAQQPQRSKQLLPQTGIVEYFPDFAISEKITGSESCIFVMVQVRRSQNLQNRLWCWSRILILKWRVSKSHKNFAVTDNIPKF